MRRLPFVIMLFAAACGGSDSNSAPKVDANAASFDLLRTQVLEPSCGSCHGTSNPNGALTLVGSGAYDAVVGKTPDNQNARLDGMKVVLPGKPDSSLLYTKLIFAPGHTGADYGNTMPQGLPSLSVGQIEFVRAWIAAGAPRTGSVADARLLQDHTVPTTVPFAALTPPPAGQGYQLHVDQFSVKANFERELFQYRPLENAKSVFVTRIQTALRPFSHHFVLYTFATGTPPLFLPPNNTQRDIRNADGSMNIGNMLPMAYHVFFGGSMQQLSDYSFPAGVALRLPPGTGIDLNLHYANRTTGDVPGEGYANIYTADTSQVQFVAEPLNFANTNFTLPPNQRTTVEKTFIVQKHTTVFYLTSHMHMLGEKFVIKIVGGARDGETVYESSDWEHPAMLALKVPIVLEKGQGLKSVITWNNTTGSTVSFGLKSTDEMGIIFGYAY